MADLGYPIDNAASGSLSWQHTPTDKFIFHDGFWWVLARDATNWCLWKKDASDPASVGTTGGWTKHLTGVVTTGFCTIWRDSSRDRAWVIGFTSGGATVQMRRLDYAAGSWTIGLSFNLCNTGGVGLGTTSTFESSIGQLSGGCDDNGVPYVVAGNQGSGADKVAGIHFAWPDSAAAINSTWTSAVIDTDNDAEADASGKFAGLITQDDVTYIVLGYSCDLGTDQHKIAYHVRETTLANYASGWVKVVVDNTKGCDNHLWAGVVTYRGRQVVCIIGKDGDSRIWLFTSELGAGMTWTHKVHRVTNGSTDVPGPTVAEASSRGTGCYDETNELFYVFYHRDQNNPEGSLDYKVADMGALLAATTETENFDTSVKHTGTRIVWDESNNRMSQAHGPAHPVNAAMGFLPVGGITTDTQIQWYGKIAISAGGGGSVIRRRRDWRNKRARVA